MYKAAIMDMDGTIIDSVSVIEGSLRQTAAGWGITVTKAMADAAKYSTNKELIGLLCEVVSAERAMAFMNEWGKAYHEAAKNTPVFPGISEVMSAPIRRAIVTSETEKELAWNLNRLGFSPELFEAVAGADTTEHTKPHPRPLLYCLSKMGVAPGEALYIGDSLNDMRCAAAAGVSFALARFAKGQSAGPDTLAALGFTGMKYVLTRPEEILVFVASR